MISLIFKIIYIFSTKRYTPQTSSPDCQRVTNYVTASSLLGRFLLVGLQSRYYSREASHGWRSDAVALPVADTLRVVEEHADSIQRVDYFILHLVFIEDKDSQRTTFFLLFFYWLI